ncbi:hypothetical protein LTR12_016653 [Friedmanniomyces endolithicus]|nr:hypothetical protein LTR12_016653 [Friedmanniomyces endolithicus]
MENFAEPCWSELFKEILAFIENELTQPEPLVEPGQVLQRVVIHQLMPELMEFRVIDVPAVDADFESFSASPKPKRALLRAIIVSSPEHCMRHASNQMQSLRSHSMNVGGEEIGGGLEIGNASAVYKGCSVNP